MKLTRRANEYIILANGKSLNVEPHAWLGGGAGHTRLPAGADDGAAPRTRRRPRNGGHPTRDARFPPTGRDGYRRRDRARRGGVETWPPPALGGATPPRNGRGG